MNLEQLRARLKEIATEMETILEAGDNLTDEQAAKFDALDEEGKTVDAEIKKLEANESRTTRLVDAKKRLEQPRPSVAERQLAAVPDPPADPGRRVAGAPAATVFESQDEAWQAYCRHLTNRGRGDDPRLQDLYAEGRDFSGFALPGLRGENTMGVGPEGGFAVPTQFRPELAGRVPVQPPVMRGLAMVIPAGDPPDAAIAMPALDQSTDIHGGVSVAWFGEGATLTETDADLRPINLEPQELGAFITVTNKLLRNWQAAAALLPALLRSAINSEEDLRFIQGDGVAKPLGFTGHASSIAIARDTGGVIKYEDLVLMETRMISMGMPVWLTSRRYSEQLRNLVTPEGQLIWGTGDANAQRPNTLLGLPVIYAPRVPALGAVGDITLLDGRFYAIKDGSPPIVASSEHVNFTSNKTVIKVTSSVDGQPLLNLPITDEDNLTYSPFVQIAA